MLSIDVRIELFNKQCLSLYGGVLWDLLDNQIVKLEVGWRKCCRNILSLSPRTHCALVPPLMNTSSIRTIIENRFVNFLINGINSKNDFIKFVFNNALTNPSKIVRNLNIVLHKHRFLYSDIFKGRKVRLKDIAHPDKWRLNIIKELV